MTSAFALSGTFVVPSSTVRQACSNGVARRSSFGRTPCSKRSRADVSMMAKFQQKEDPAKNLDEEAKIEGVVPPVNLPSLRSLTNQGPLFGEELEPVAEEKAEVATEEVPDFSRMGASMSSEEEFQAIAFLKSVAEELKNIEWPPADRVFKITVIILVSIVVASAGIYVVDGFFYSIAQILFETNV